VPAPHTRSHSLIQLPAHGNRPGGGMSPIMSMDDCSEAGSVTSLLSITSLSRPGNHHGGKAQGREQTSPLLRAKQKRREEFGDSDAEEGEEGDPGEDDLAHARWSKENMTDERLRALAENLKEAVLADSQVGSDAEYQRAMSTPEGGSEQARQRRKGLNTPLLNDRGQLALALRKTFLKFSGSDQANGESNARNKKFWLEKQERESLRRNYEDSSKRHSRAALSRSLTEVGSRGPGSDEDDLPTDAPVGSLVGTGRLSNAPGGALRRDRDRARVPLVLDAEEAARREGYYAPAVPLFTDDMRLELESIRRKPYFDADGELVTPARTADPTLSSGLAGVPLGVAFPRTKAPNPPKPDIFSSPQSRSPSPGDRDRDRDGHRAMTPLDEIRVNPPSPKSKAARAGAGAVQPLFSSGAIGMFRGDSKTGTPGDGPIPLSFDMDNDFFLQRNSAPSEGQAGGAGGDESDHRRRRLLDKHLSADKLGDAVGFGLGPLAAPAGADFSLPDDGEGEVLDAYRTLLDIKTNPNPKPKPAAPAQQQQQRGRQSHSLSEEEEEEEGSTYRLFQKDGMALGGDMGGAGDDASSQSSKSLPYPFPFPSTMYEAKPVPRAGASPLELGLTGQQVPLYEPPRAARAGREGAGPGPGQLQDASTIKPVLADHSLVVPPPPCWDRDSAALPGLDSPLTIDPHPPLTQAQALAQRERSGDDASAASDQELFTPLGVTQASVSVGSSRHKGRGGSSGGRRRRTSNGGFADEEGEMPGDLELFNGSSILSGGEQEDHDHDFEQFVPCAKTEEDFEAEMDAELRRIFRGGTPGTAPGPDSGPGAGAGAGAGNGHLPKIGVQKPSRGHSTTALPLALDPFAARPPKQHQSTGSLSKLNSLARTLSEANTAGEPSPRVTGNKSKAGGGGNKMSAGLMSAGSASVGSLSGQGVRMNPLGGSATGGFGMGLKASKSSRRI
jgi:hypothetical protein